MKRSRIIVLTILILSLILNVCLILCDLKVISFKLCDINNKKLVFTGEFVFNSKVDSLMRSFVKYVNNDSCLFEMIVDKRNYRVTYIHLIAREDSKRISDGKQELINYLNDKKPVLYWPINQKIGYFIYTGMEDIISLKDTSYKKSLYSNMDLDFYKYWNIVVVDNKYLLYKDVLINPFSVMDFDYVNQKKLRFK